VGANGAGKSTLLKILAGVLPYEGGTRQVGHNATLVYYAQHALDALHPRNTVLAEISQAASTAMQPKIRGLLAAFLFDAGEWDKTVSVLSGGEKARLALAKMMLRPANLLLLDEPTNHLDLRSRDVLEEALAEYTGTICFISHDRYFINRIATTICEVDSGGLSLFPGNYDDYLARKASLAQEADPGDTKPARRSRRTAAPTRAPRTSSPAGTMAAEPATGPRTRQQKRREAEARQRFSLASHDTAKKIEKIENRIGEEEKRLRLVEYEMSQPAIYQNPQKARGTARLQNEIKARIADLTARWEELSEKLEGARAQLTSEMRSIADD
jgi:ATP-binding cassette subfamily F protein 3